VDRLEQGQNGAVAFSWAAGDGEMVDAELANGSSRARLLQLFHGEKSCPSASTFESIRVSPPLLFRPALAEAAIPAFYCPAALFLAAELEPGCRPLAPITSARGANICA